MFLEIFCMSLSCFVNRIYKFMPYYAVAKGRNVGIYDTWAKCEGETKGFANARFKKFDTATDAMEFIRANSESGQSFAPKSFERTGYPPNVATLSSTSSSYANSGYNGNNTGGGMAMRYSAGTITITQPKTKAYYAVAKGAHPGIYNTWPECQVAIRDFPFAKYRKFDSYEEAKKFCDENRSHSSTNRSLNKRSFSEDESGSKRLAYGSGDVPEAPVVYTDGACSNNGKTSAAAGFGIWWGDNHSDNIAAPVSGEPTNNRAEYEAILVAMKQARDKGLKALTICTDSKLLISSMDNWLKKWKGNGWKTVKGENVRNKDLLEKIDGIRGDVNVKFQHVNGHVGIHGNEMADALAREGARKFLAKKMLK